MRSIKTGYQLIQRAADGEREDRIQDVHRGTERSPSDNNVPEINDDQRT